MGTTMWSTREALPDAFATAWEARLSRTPLAHHAMRLDYLAWQARHGEHARALLVDEDVAGAVVLRESRGGWVSGWPWRWQAVVDSAAGIAGLTAEQAGTLARAAARQAGGRRVTCFAPAASPAGWPGYVAGHTILLDLAAPEEELRRSLDKTKQYSIKRAGRDGFQVVVADRAEQFEAFARLQRETDSRRGAGGGEPLPADPAPGESWREWELPWQWLLVAEREGVVEAGSGFGVRAGGTLEYRTNASSLAAKKSGANVLLAWEAIRRGRELGYRRVNWGGATLFKRDMGGEPITVWCGLGGSGLWRLPNEVSASIQRARPQMAALWRHLRKTKERKQP